MSVDRFIDEKTGDLVGAAHGAWRLDTTLRNQILFSLSIELGAWEGDPTLGHRFAELARAIDSADTRQRLGDLVRAALKWLVDAGSLTRIDVTVEAFAPGMLAYEADCITPSGETISIGRLFAAVGA